MKARGNIQVRSWALGKWKLEILYMKRICLVDFDSEIAASSAGCVLLAKTESSFTGLNDELCGSVIFARGKVLTEDFKTCDFETCDV